MEVTQSKLNTVIRIKDILLKRHQKELADISSQKEEASGVLKGLEDTREQAYADAVSGTRTKARDAQISESFIRSLSRQIQSQEKKVDDMGKAEDDKRDTVKGVSQSKRMLEELEDRRQTEADKEVERKAQRLIDVLAHRMNQDK
jgi:flagellar export protein FliJ